MNGVDARSVDALMRGCEIQVCAFGAHFLLPHAAQASVASDYNRNRREATSLKVVGRKPSAVGRGPQPSAPLHFALSLLFPFLIKI